MSAEVTKIADPVPANTTDDEAILHREVNWTVEEEKKAKRKSVPELPPVSVS
jgi:hypothetical protein